LTDRPGPFASLPPSLLPLALLPGVAGSAAATAAAGGGGVTAMLASDLVFRASLSPACCNAVMRRVTSDRGLPNLPGSSRGWPSRNTPAVQKQDDVREKAVHACSTVMSVMHRALR
jgi:hypothetical protein